MLIIVFKHAYGFHTNNNDRYFSCKNLLVCNVIAH